MDICTADSLEGFLDWLHPDQLLSPLLSIYVAMQHKNAAKALIMWLRPHDGDYYLKKSGHCGCERKNLGETPCQNKTSPRAPRFRRVPRSPEKISSRSRCRSTGRKSEIYSTMYYAVLCRCNPMIHCRNLHILHAFVLKVDCKNRKPSENERESFNGLAGPGNLEIFICIKSFYTTLRRKNGSFHSTRNWFLVILYIW